MSATSVFLGEGTSGEQIDTMIGPARIIEFLEFFRRSRSWLNRLASHVRVSILARSSPVAAVCMAAKMTVLQIAEMQLAYPTFTPLVMRPYRC